MKPSSRITRNRFPGNWQHSRLIVLALSVLMLLSILLAAFHHHDDGQDHDDDCPICAVAHHRIADITLTLPDVAYLPFSFPAYFAALVLTIAPLRFCYSPQKRAPPVSVSRKS
jgi:hypothetical protein